MVSVPIKTVHDSLSQQSALHQWLRSWYTSTRFCLHPEPGLDIVETVSVYADYIALQCAGEHLATAAGSQLSKHSLQRHGQVQHLATPAQHATATRAPHATACPIRTSNAAAWDKA
jgi:hypothetical protein